MLFIRFSPKDTHSRNSKETLCVVTSKFCSYPELYESQLFITANAEGAFAKESIFLGADF